MSCCLWQIQVLRFSRNFHEPTWNFCNVMLSIIQAHWPPVLHVEHVEGAELWSGRGWVCYGDIRVHKVSRTWTCLSTVHLLSDGMHKKDDWNMWLDLSFVNTTNFLISVKSISDSYQNVVYRIDDIDIHVYRVLAILFLAKSPVVYRNLPSGQWKRNCQNIHESAHFWSVEDRKCILNTIMLIYHHGLSSDLQKYVSIWTFWPFYQHPTY